MNAINNHPSRTTASRELIAEWECDQQVGIWDTTATIRLYADRALYKGSKVKWSGNSGHLANDHRRITGQALAELLSTAAAEVEDDADYTDHAFSAAHQCDMY